MTGGGCGGSGVICVSSGGYSKSGSGGCGGGFGGSASSTVNSFRSSRISTVIISSGVGKCSRRRKRRSRSRSCWGC